MSFSYYNNIMIIIIAGISCTYRLKCKIVHKKIHGVDSGVKQTVRESHQNSELF